MFEAQFRSVHVGHFILYKSLPMKYIYFTIIFVFFIFTACAPIATPEISSTVAAAETLMPTLTPTKTPEPSPTLVKTLNFFYPEIERVCPANREVPINQLGVDAGSQLILTDINQTSIWRLSFNDSAPQQISQLSTANWIGRSLSPNGNWIAHPVWNADSSSSIWLLSLITGEHREVLNIKYQDGLAPYTAWVSDQEVLVVNRCHTRRCHFPLRIINIETGKYDDVEVDSDERNGTFLTLFKNPTGSYALFSDNFDEDKYASFFVYDYAAAQKIAVFPWLEQKVFPFLRSNIGFEFSQNNLAMVIDQTYGFDVGIVENSMRSFTKAETYDIAMKRVTLGHGIEYDLDRSSVSLIGLNALTDSLFLGISYTYDSSILESDTITPVEPISVENGFFSMDYQHVGQDNSLVFKDYCFSMAESFFLAVSIDGRIAFFESKLNDEIILINLETGYLSRLPGWNFLR